MNQYYTYWHIDKNYLDEELSKFHNITDTAVSDIFKSGFQYRGCYKPSEIKTGNKMEQDVFDQSYFRFVICPINSENDMRICMMKSPKKRLVMQTAVNGIKYSISGLCAHIVFLKTEHCLKAFYFSKDSMKVANLKPVENSRTFVFTDEYLFDIDCLTNEIAAINFKERLVHPVYTTFSVLFKNNSFLLTKLTSVICTEASGFKGLLPLYGACSVKKFLEKVNENVSSRSKINRKIIALKETLCVIEERDNLIFYQIQNDNLHNVKTINMVFYLYQVYTKDYFMRYYWQHKNTLYLMYYCPESNSKWIILGIDLLSVKVFTLIEFKPKNNRPYFELFTSENERELFVRESYDKSVHRFTIKYQPYKLEDILAHYLRENISFEKFNSTGLPRNIKSRLFGVH